MTREEFEAYQLREQAKTEERRLKRERNRCSRYVEMIGWRLDDLPRLDSLLAKSSGYWAMTFRKQIAEQESMIAELTEKCPEAREMIDTNPDLALLYRARLKMHNAGNPRAYLDNFNVDDPQASIETSDQGEEHMVNTSSKSLGSKEPKKEIDPFEGARHDAVWAPKWNKDRYEKFCEMTNVGSADFAGVTKVVLINRTDDMGRMVKQEIRIFADTYEHAWTAYKNLVGVFTEQHPEKTRGMFNFDITREEYDVVFDGWLKAASEAEVEYDSRPSTTPAPDVRFVWESYNEREQSHTLQNTPFGLDLVTAFDGGDPRLEVHGRNEVARDMLFSGFDFHWAQLNHGHFRTDLDEELFSALGIRD